MLSTEAQILMSNGTTKSISSIKVGDLIINKLNNSVKVITTHICTENSVAVQFNNGTGIFYCSPTTLFLNHTTLTNGSHTSNYCTINNALSDNVKLKNSAKIFSPESDIEIINYDNTNVIKELYCIHTNESSMSYFANGVIVKCNED